MIRRLLLLAGALLVVLAASAAPASAQYGGGGATATANGRNVTVDACCFAPGSTVTFTAGGNVLGTAVAGSDGRAVGSFTIPASVASGNVTVTAAGTGSNGQPVSVNTAVRLPGSGAGNQGQGQGNQGSGQLPRTGSGIALPLSIGGALLIGLGGLFVLTTRRRQTADVS